jgi:hypothetical protein
MTVDQQQRNHHLKSKRWMIEQTFSPLKRRLKFHQTAYFGEHKVLGQSYLHKICADINLTLGKNLKSENLGFIAKVSACLHSPVETE